MSTRQRQLLFVLVMAVFLLFIVVAVEAATITYEFTFSSAAFSFDFGTGTSNQQGHFSYDDVLVPVFNGLGYRVIDFELDGLHFDPERDVYWVPQPQFDNTTIEIFSGGANDQWELFDQGGILRFQLFANPDGVGGFSGHIAGNGVYATVTFLMTPVPKIIYVDADAAGNNNGSSWPDAYNYLQDALTAAYNGDEIRVAQGVYKPDQGAGITPGDREATFQLKNGVTLKGGYAGYSEPDPNARDIKLYETILTGDLDGNDIDVNDSALLLWEPTRAENSYHVVTAVDTDETAVFDGFTITAGNANGKGWPVYQNFGGGMYNDSGSPSIINCTFSDNSALNRGGGIYNWGGSPTLTNCTFSGNSAEEIGGGIKNNNGSPRLTNCTFIGNSARYSGGGVYSGSSRYVNLMLTNCIFKGNWSYSSYGAGGGLCCDNGRMMMIKCTFSGNSARRGGGMWYIDGNDGSQTLASCRFSGNSAYEGGGMYCTFSSPTLNNCTFSGNSASDYGGGIYGEDSSNPTLTNCILWGNSDSEIESSAVVTYSDIKGGWPGIGNIDADPCFVGLGYLDANGVWVEGDYHLLTGSPCIDAGDPNYIAEPNETDLDGRPRVIGGRIDMGAYETPIQAEARIVPRTINLASKGKWLSCSISLPEEYNVADIEPNSILLEDEIKPDEFSVDEQQQVATARFSREEVQAILSIGEVELTITGQLTDGTVFEGTDVIRVLNKAGKK